MTKPPDKTLKELEKDYNKMPNPIPLEQNADLANPDPFPVELLPKLAQKAVTSYQSYGQQPLSMVASSSLASMSLATQGLANVARDDNLISPISLNFIVIAESGERKTAGDKFFSTPIRVWEQEQIDSLASDIKANKASLAVHNAKKEGIINKIKKASATSNSDSILKLEDDLRQLELNCPRKITVPKLFHEETTAEALAYSLATGWPSSSLWSDEAGIIIGSQGMNQDNMLKAITLLNRLWDGNAYRVDRKTSDNFKVEGRRLTCSLMMQPVIFEQFISKCGNITRGSGFLARCLLTMPLSTMGCRLYKEPKNTSIDANLFNQRIVSLLNTQLPLDDHGRLVPKTLYLTPTAKEAWVAFHNAIEQELHDNGQYGQIKDFASKAAENVARLAAIFHIFEGAQSEHINEETISCAVGIVTWFLNEANRIALRQAIPQEYKDAKLLIDWFIEKKITNYNATDLLRYGPNSLRYRARRDKAIKVLSDHHHIEVCGNQLNINSKLNTPAIPAISATDKCVNSDYSDNSNIIETKNI